MTGRWLHGSICLGLAVLTLAAMGHVCRNDFINLDDGTYITTNPYVQQGLTGPDIYWALTTFHGGYWMPTTWLSFQLDATLFWPAENRFEPAAATQAAWGFHLTNLIFHLANVLLVYVVLARLTHAPGRSAMVAALFAIHPLHVESVAWITARKDVLSTFFLLLCLLAYEVYVRRKSMAAYLVLLICFLVGLASKPMLVTLPCVLLLLDYWPLGRWSLGQTIADAPEEKKEPLSVGWLLLEKVPLFLMSLGFGFLTIYTQHRAGAVSTSLTLESRLTTTVVGYVWYLKKTFWPTKLGLLYPYRNLHYGSTEVLVSLAILLIVTLWVLVRSRKQPALLVGWLIFLGTLFPVSGFFQSGDQAAADRFVYVPHLGLLCMIVWAAADGLRRLRVPTPLQAGLGLGVVGFLSYLTWLQVALWQNTDTIMSHSVIAIDGNHHAYECLGIYLLDQDNAAGALSMAGRALRHEQNARYYLLQAQAYDKLGRPEEKLQALRKVASLLETLLEHETADPTLYSRLGEAYYILGETDAARRALLHSLELRDDQAPAHFTLGRIALAQGKPRDALNHLDRAVSYDPRLAQAWDRKGIALGQLERWNDALACFEKTRELQPKGTYYRAGLAFALWKLNRVPEAQEEYRHILALDRDWARKAASLAMNRATNPNPALRDLNRALELAQQACQAEGFRDPVLLDCQAEVFAAAGRLKDALASARLALERSTDPAHRKSLQDKIERYGKR